MGKTVYRLFCGETLAARSILRLRVQNREPLLEALAFIERMARAAAQFFTFGAQFAGLTNESAYVEVGHRSPFLRLEL